MSVESMVASIRRTIRDDRFVVPSFNLSCIDEDVTSALVEITGGMFVTTIAGGTAGALSLNLEDAAYNTVGKLQNYLSTRPGYNCAQIQGMEEDFPSIELEVTGPMDIRSVGFDFRTRVFSDQELEGFLRRAVTRHNPSVTLENLRSTEEHLVLTLCQADLMRTLANDAVRRKNLEMTVDELLKLADQFEKVYKADAQRLARVISTPVETSDEVGTGDIMVGDLIRASKRTGVAYPIESPLGRDCPVEFLNAEKQSAEDTTVTIRWTRKRSASFWRLEIWRDTQPGVRRTNDQATDPTTAKKMLSDLNIIRTEFKDTNLEPGMTYYYKVYVIDTTSEYQESQDLTLTTLALRASFGATPIAPATSDDAGPWVVSLTAYNAGTTEVFIEGKKLTGGTWDSMAGTLTFAAIPSFTQRGKKDLLVRDSATKLFDLRTEGFEVV